MSSLSAQDDGIIDSIKVKHPDQPVLENETIFSSSAPFVNNNDSVASTLKNTIGKVSENLRTTMQNAKDKIMDVLAVDDKSVDETETIHIQENDMMDLKRHVSLIDNSGSAKKQRLQSSASSQLPPPLSNSGTSIMANNHEDSSKPQQVADTVPVDLSTTSPKEEQNTTSFVQTLVEAETEIEVTAVLDSVTADTQQTIAEISPETVDQIIALVPMGGADLRVLTDELASPSQNDVASTALNTSEQLSALLEGNELQTLCSTLMDSNDNVVINAVDALSRILASTETTGQLERAVEIAVSQNTPAVLKELMQHDNWEVSGRAERLRDTYFMSDEELQKLDESFLEEDDICEDAETLCCELTMRGDDEALITTLNNLSELLDTTPDGDPLDSVVRAISECGGEDSLRRLVDHENSEVRDNASSLLDVYFPSPYKEEEEEDDAEDDLTQLALRVKQGHIEELCVEMMSSDGQAVRDALENLQDIVSSVDEDLFIRVDAILTECGGRGTLEVLEKHANEEIANLAQDVLVLLRARELTGNDDDDEEDEEGDENSESEAEVDDEKIQSGLF